MSIVVLASADRPRPSSGLQNRHHRDETLRLAGVVHGDSARLQGRICPICGPTNIGATHDRTSSHNQLGSSLILPFGRISIDGSIASDAESILGAIYSSSFLAFLLDSSVFVPPPNKPNAPPNTALGRLVSLLKLAYPKDVRKQSKNALTTSRRLKLAAWSVLSLRLASFTANSWRCFVS